MAATPSETDTLPLEALEAEVAELIDSLAQYGWHKLTCARETDRTPNPPPCDCGWDRAFRRALDANALVSDLRGFITAAEEAAR